MNFCPNCNNVFDIAKLNKQQLGGNKLTYSTIIKMAIANELQEADIKDLDMTDFINTYEYKKLKTKQREIVYNTIQDLLPNDKKNIEQTVKNTNDIYYKCRNCGYFEKLPARTLISTIVSNNISGNYAISDASNMKYSEIIPFTRKYLCPNEKCISHKDPSKKEAKFFRNNNQYNIKYICLACDTQFNYS